MLMERGQIPRQQGNVGSEQELGAFHLSALQVRLRTLTPPLQLKIIRQIQNYAVLQMQQLPGAARKNRRSFNNIILLCC